MLDPMCGVRTILLEAAQDHKVRTTLPRMPVDEVIHGPCQPRSKAHQWTLLQDVHFLGVDIDDGQLQRANENVAFADLRERIHLMKASCSGTHPPPSPSSSHTFCRCLLCVSGFPVCVCVCVCVCVYVFVFSRPPCV